MHFPANSADKKRSKPLDGSLDKWKGKFPRSVFRDGSFQILNARVELSERKPGLAGLSMSWSG
jgi:hypothetical protein